MDEHTLKVLEFEKIRLFLRQFATSEPGKKNCDKLKPLNKIEEIKISLREVGEMREVFRKEGDLPIHGIKDIAEIVNKARVENSILTSRELLEIMDTLGVARRLKRFFKRLPEEEYPQLKGITKNLIILDELERKIRNAIGTQGEILDNASSELKEIRLRIRQLREKIRQTLERLLSQEEMALVFQEKFITLRNNRYVLPVKTEYKNYLPGIVHDQSQSRATFFIEPLSIVESNNELSLLLSDESNEELRILSELTREVGRQIAEILTDLDLLGRIDLIYAKAKLSERLDGIEPSLNDQGKINLLQCRHPILLSTIKKIPEGEEEASLISGVETITFVYEFDNSKVIPVDIRMNPSTKTLIITGANAGGKTVTLKTLGLLSLMAQAGIHIPVKEGSEISVFHSILADIGDEQNLEDNLSTFSAHMLRLKFILQEAGPKVLVLLDELGSGTDPTEGAALALAILDFLRERGAKSVITTHLHLLKTYAYLYPEAENVAVEFDSVTLKPTFRLIYGVPGMSNALAIARNLGISSKILEEASQYLNSGDHQMVHLIRALEERERYLKIKEEEIARLKEMHQLTLDKANELYNLFSTRKEKILTEYENKMKFLLREVEVELKQIIEDAKRKERAELEERKKALKSVKEKISLQVKQSPQGKGIERLEVGEKVSLYGSAKVGRVIQTDNIARKAEIQIGNLRIWASFNELQKVKDEIVERVPAEKFQKRLTTTEWSPKINLIGMRVEEAIPVLEKAIDNALLFGFSQLEIIHGVGTGRLRKAVAEFLKEHSQIKRFKSGDPKKGGLGVTIAEIG